MSLGTRLQKRNAGSAGGFMARACALVMLALTIAAAPAQAAPTLTVTPGQARTRAKLVGLVPAWDTAWWVDVHARRGDVALRRLEYRVRLSDSQNTRPLVGGWDLSGADADGLSGRIDVRGALQADYDRKVQVQLRVHDAEGGTSEWAFAEFPVDDWQPPAAPAAEAKAVPEPEPAVSQSPLGTVQIEASNEMTIEQARRLLLQQARARGGDGIENLRVVDSTATRLTFAAVVIRNGTPTPAPLATQTVTPAHIVAAARVIGTIDLPDQRR